MPLLFKALNHRGVFGPLIFYFISIIIFSSCSGIFYHPDSVVYTTPDKFDLKYESVFFKSTNGNKLNAWILPAQGESTPIKGTVILFHGNAQNLSSHFLSLAWMSLKGYQVIVFDYQGYGKSEGSPNQERLNGDAIAALNYAYNRWKNGGGDKFIVYGQSLGGVISLRALKDFAFSDKISLLVLDSTFMSYKDVAFNKMTSILLAWPFSPLAYLLFSDEYAASKVLNDIPAIPTLVIHGTDDNVIEFKNGYKIFAEIKTPIKWFWKIDGGAHIDVFFNHDKIYRDKFIKLLDSLN